MQALSCKKCSFTGDTQTIMREHDRVAHQKKGRKKFAPKSSVCKLCDFTYSRAISLSRHMKTVHDKKVEKKAQVFGEGRIDTTQLKIDLKSYFDFCDKKKHGKGRVNCGQCRGCNIKDDCGKCRYCRDKPKFGGPNTLRKKCLERVCLNVAKEPPKVTNLPRKMSCDDCSFQSRGAGQLRDHIRKDHAKDGDVYACKFCEYTYSRVSSLSRDGIQYCCN